MFKLLIVKNNSKSSSTILQNKTYINPFLYMNPNFSKDMMSLRSPTNCHLKRFILILEVKEVIVEMKAKVCLSKFDGQDGMIFCAEVKLFGLAIILSVSFTMDSGGLDE